MPFSGKILIVDDEPHVRKFVSLIVRGLGTPTVIEATDGQDAVAKYTAEQPDLTLLDVNMQLMDGLQTLAAIQQLPAKLRLQILALGATRGQMVWVLVKEAKLPLLAAIMAGFGGVISEVGASIMVGGNIKGYSRVLTTATVMETSKGNFDMAMALGIILLLLSFLINAVLTQIQQRERPR